MFLVLVVINYLCSCYRTYPVGSSSPGNDSSTSEYSSSSTVSTDWTPSEENASTASVQSNATSSGFAEIGSTTSDECSLTNSEREKDSVQNDVMGEVDTTTEPQRPG